MPTIQPQLPNIEQYRMLKQAQQMTLAQHAVFSKGLEEKKAQVQSKQSDLDVASRLFKVLDSRVPKSARQFLNTQLAQHVGVDPNNEAFKRTNTMILGLDPETLQNLKTQLGVSIQDAEPGQITEMTRGLMTGQLPLDGFMTQFDLTGSAQMQPGGEGQAQPAQAQPAATQPTQKAAQPFQPGAPGAVQSFEGQRTVPAASQQASPMLVGALGLDSRTPLRNNDLFAQGYRIPMSAQDQEKLAGDITTRSTGLSSTVSEAANMLTLFQGHPETLGPVGSVARSVSGTIQQVQGFLNIVRPGTTVEGPDELTNGMARKVGIDILKAHGIQTTADNAARIQAMSLGLAYRMAVANDVPGNRLTNGIIQQNLAQLGQSSSPTAFEAVLRDTISSTSREYNEFMRRTTGVDGLPLFARQMGDADIGRLSRAGNMVPLDMAVALRDETARRLRGDATPTVTPQSPTIQEEQQTLGGLETRNKERKIGQVEQEMSIQEQQNQRAIGAEQRAEGREERVAATSEHSQDLEERKFKYLQEEQARDNQRAEAAAARSEAREERVAAGSSASAKLQREEFEYRKAHDVHQEELKNRQIISNAFQEFGKAIAGLGGSVGGLPQVQLPSGQQDTSAFRLTPAPQRTPPRPAGGQ